MTLLLSNVLAKLPVSALHPHHQLARCLTIRGLQQTRHYSKEVRDHFKNPRNVGAFKKDEENIGTAIVGKASCGDVIKLQVKVEDNVIKDVKFKAFGCGSAIASSSLASELIKGKTTEEALKLKNVDIANELSLPPVKIHCSLLAEDAIKMAVKDYKKKHTQPTASKT